MAWSTQYVDDILKPAIVEWNKAKSEGREEVIRETCKKLYAKQAANPTKLAELKATSELAKQVAWWFKNNQKRFCNDGHEDSSGEEGTTDKRRKSAKKGKGKEKATASNQYDEEDDAEGPTVDASWHKRMTGPLMAKAYNEDMFKDVLSSHKDQAFRNRFNFAISEFWNTFTDEEKEDYSRKAREWNKRGPPNNMKATLARRSMQESMNSVVEYFSTYFDASIVMFSVAPGDGEPIVRWHETKDGKSPSKFIKPSVFRAFREEWLNAVPTGLYGDPEDLEDNDGAERDSWAVVDETEEGQPILPQMPAGARNEAMVKVFREYGNAIAAYYSHGEKKTLPWLRLSQKNKAYMHSKSRVAGVQFGEPSKMSIGDVRSYYMHFLERQNNGSMGLRLIDGWDINEKNKDGGKEIEMVVAKKRRGSAVDSDQRKRAKSTPEETDEDREGDGDDMIVDKDDMMAPMQMLAPAQVMNEDRILFLQSLSTEVDYLAMIQWLHMCKQGQVSPRLNRRAPAWASWALNTPYLPEEFYQFSNDERDREGFAAAKAYLMQDPLPHVGLGDAIGPYERVEKSLLILGLMLRDMAKVCFLEPDSDMANRLPDYMQQSHFALAEWDELTEVCKQIKNSLSKWEEQVKQSERRKKSTMSGPKVSAAAGPSAGPKLGAAGPKLGAAGPKLNAAGPKLAAAGPQAEAGAGPELHATAPKANKAGPKAAPNWIGTPSRIPSDLQTLAAVCGCLREDGQVFATFNADWRAVVDNYWALEGKLLNKATDEDGRPHQVKGLPERVNAWVAAYQEGAQFDVKKLVSDPNFGAEVWEWWKGQKEENAKVLEENGLDGLLTQPFLQRGGRGMLVMLWAVKVWGKGVASRGKTQGAEAKRCAIMCTELRKLFADLIKAPIL
ncbi:Homeobox domain-containing protein [Pleurotus pulmonarius]|nr:hypothetical protein EYR36_009978 [Pleurotus pulmonarius]KAF4593454.1 hypothetical protein EYR38_009169 [Pleurotus pulmonarius]